MKSIAWKAVLVVSALGFLTSPVTAATYSLFDAASCYAIGSWDSASATCTMDRDVTGGQVQITAPGITLDCANHTIGGDRYGISLVGVTDVTVQNCVINPSQLTGCRGIDSSGHRHRFLHNTFP